MQLEFDNPVKLERCFFDHMVKFVHVIEDMARMPEYETRLEPYLPTTAQFIPSRPAMLMGYDFHITQEGPKLIEINNNAGGLHMAGSRWMPQPNIPELPGSLELRLLRMFPDSLRHIAILDDDIEHQHMYPEMLAYADLLRSEGRSVWLATPESLEAHDDGLWIDGKRLDGIYNRHTDFYLETESMAHIRQAFLQGTVDLNPYPRSYAFLGDKARMADWWRQEWLKPFLSAKSISMIHAIVPETHMFQEMEAQDVWTQRRNWVFKPAARHGGKGVIVGKNITRKRFSTMGPDTIIQQFVPPSVVEVGGSRMKFDVRLYTYGYELIAIAGRIWQGQITNFRTEGSGWVSIDIV